jgi:hypothetical protein
MSTHEHASGQDRPQSSFLTSRVGLVLICFLVIAGVLLFTEHRAHVLGILIWLPLLACPLMHLFMHGGHGGHGGHDHHDRERTTP